MNADHDRYRQNLPCKGVALCSVCWAPAHVGCPMPQVRKGMDSDPIQWPAAPLEAEEMEQA